MPETDTDTGAQGQAAPVSLHASTRGTVRQLWNLALPIVGLNILAVVTLAVDTIMCGRLEDADAALTALGFAVQIAFFLMVMMIGLSVGAVAMVARAYGAREHDRVNHILAQSVTLTGIIGVLVAVFGNLLAAPMLSVLGASPDIVAKGLEYLRPLLCGQLFLYIALLYSAILRGVGNTRLPFLVALLSNAVNIVLDYGLILGNLGLPKLGVQGAAYATIVAYVVNVAAIVLVLHRGAIPGLIPRLRPARIDGKLFMALLRVGTPAALDVLVLNISFLAMIGMIGHIDEIAVAAHGVGIRIQALAFVPGLGIAQAAAALVGQALGAGAPDRARATTRAAVVLCSSIMSLLGLAIIVGAYPIVALFDIQSGTDLEAYAVLWMIYLGACMPPAGIHIAFIGMLRGAGATRTSLAINIIGTLAIQVPLALVLAFVVGMGVSGVWLSFPLSIVGKACLSWQVFRRGAWARVGSAVP